MRKILVTVLALATPAALADVMAINVWQPHPGMTATMFEAAEISRAIHERLGAEVIIANDQMQNMHYVMRFKNFTHQSEVFAKMMGDKEWQERVADIDKEERGTRVQLSLINIVSPAEDRSGSVYESFVWQPEPGHFGAMMGQAAEAKAIHEKTGVNVEIGFDRLNRLVYIVLYEDWAHWAKIQDTPNEEFMEWFNSREGTATLVEHYSGMIR